MTAQELIESGNRYVEESLDKMINEEIKEITAKFDSACFETSREIKQGDKILWIPGTRKVFCLESKQAEKYFNYKKGVK
jgi:hypothetical protein